MIPNMIALVGKYHQVIKAVVKTITINMMDDMSRLDTIHFGDFSSGNSLPLPILVVRSFLLRFQVSVIAFYRAVQVFCVTHLAAWAGEGLAASPAGNCQCAVFSGVDPIALEQLPESLSGSAIPFGKLDQGHKVNSIGINDVNFVFNGQSGCHIAPPIKG